jgi:hypothetical protein
MTKDAYLEMCELMGSEPIDSEIPVEYDDFPYEVQQAFTVYKMLEDKWDSMTGVYFGKSLLGIKDLLETCEIDPEDHKFVVLLIKIIDSVRSKEIAKKQDKPAT